ncbi:hypothetical protein ABK040_004983 [Willaertia magna]
MVDCCCKPCNKEKNKDDFDNKVIGPEYGINRKRGCTDILCIPIFLLFWIGMLVIAAFGFWSGNPAALIEPIDFAGNMCGYAQGSGNNNAYNLTGKPYLWYPFEFQPQNIMNISSSRLLDALQMGVCVKSCPNDIVNILDPMKNLPFDAVVCRYDVSPKNAFDKLLKAYHGEGCYFNYFPHEVYFKRCIPMLENSTVDQAVQVVFKQTIKFTNGLKQGLSEVWRSWPALIISAFLCLVLCFVFVLLMRLFVGILVRVVILVFGAVLGCSGGYILYIGVQKWRVSDFDEELRKSARYWLAGGGIILACFVIYLLLVLFLWRRIRKTIAILKEGSRAVNKFPTMLLIPIIGFVLIIGLSFWWAIVAAFLQSSQKPLTLSANDPRWSKYMSEISTFMNTTKFGNMTITVGEGTTALQVLNIYNIFAYFWGVAFIDAVVYCTLAGVVAGWYFSGVGDDKKVEKLSLFKSFYRVVRYHLGSLIFGSLIVAIVQMLRYLFRKIKQRLQQKLLNNAISKLALNAIEAVLWVIEKIVKYINKNAYIMIAVHGSGFCQSASRAFVIIVENILIVGTTNTISDVVLFLARVTITVFSSVICYLLIDLNNTYGFFKPIMPTIDYAIIPSVVAAIATFFITTMFMLMYETAIDTILICVSYELFINPDEKQGPYYMSSRLRRVYLGSKKMNQESSGCCGGSKEEKEENKQEKEMKESNSK